MTAELPEMMITTTVVSTATTTAVVTTVMSTTTVMMMMTTTTVGTTGLSMVINIIFCSLHEQDLFFLPLWLKLVKIKAGLFEPENLLRVPQVSKQV